MQIKTTKDFKDALRSGADEWPGGYPVYFICQDGGVLSFKAAHGEAKLIIRAIRCGHDPQWRVIGKAINWEDRELTCDHTNDRIESVYE